MDKTLSQCNALFELSRSKPWWIKRAPDPLSRKKSAIAALIALVLVSAVLAVAAVVVRHW